MTGDSEADFWERSVESAIYMDQLVRSQAREFGPI